MFDEEFVINQPVEVGNIIKLYHPNKLYETRVHKDGMLVGVGLLDGEMHLLIV